MIRLEKLRPHDRATLESLFKITQKSLINVVDNFLKNKYEKVNKTKDYVYAIGNIPVLLVAHLDTVFDKPPTDIYYDSGKGVMWSPQGLGADDRAGVWAIIKIIRSGLRPHILFTTDEELGGLGADKFIDKYPTCPFGNLKYIIQLDRRGTNDCVFYDCWNDKFLEYVESFGFCENWGSFTDISIICPKWKIAGVNLSVGYEDEHSVSETLHIIPLNQTIEKVIKMLKVADRAEHFEYVENPYSKYYWPYYSGKDIDIKAGASKCHYCGFPHLDVDMFPLKTEDGKTAYACDNCVGKVGWCQRCSEAFEITKNSFSDILCPDCEAELFQEKVRYE